jgi:CRP-like cAMP-binding protein
MPAIKLESIANPMHDEFTSIDSDDTMKQLTRSQDERNSNGMGNPSLAHIETVGPRKTEESGSAGAFSGIDALIETVPMFQSIGKKNSKTLLESVTEMEFVRSDVIIERGDDPDCFYVMTGGEAVACAPSGSESKTTNIIKCYRRGGIFGERGVVRLHPPEASVIVSSVTARCLRIVPKDASSLMALFIGVPIPSNYAIRQPGDRLASGIAAYEDPAHSDSKVRERVAWNKCAEKQARKRAQADGAGAGVRENLSWEYYIDEMPWALACAETRRLRRHLHSYSTSEVQRLQDESIAQPVLLGASDRLISVITQAMISIGVQSFQPGEVILQPQEIPTRIYVLFDGEVALSPVAGFFTDWDAKVTVTRAGAIFGEEAVEGRTSHFAVEAITAVTAYASGLLTQGGAGGPPGPLASSLRPPLRPLSLTIPTCFPLHSHGI